MEAVHAKLDVVYKSAHDASVDAMRELSGTIIAITLVMAAVFVPVSFIGGSSGVFFKQFGLTLASAIIISAINALTLSPALCALFLKPHEAEVTIPDFQNSIWQTENAINTLLGRQPRSIQRDSLDEQ